MNPFQPNLAAALIFTCAMGTVDVRKLLVGPGKTYSMPMQAAAVAQDGDTVEIEAGVYTGETATWRAHNLVLRGTAAYARLVAPAVISNQKAIWVIQGRNTTVENIRDTRPLAKPIATLQCERRSQQQARIDAFYPKTLFK